MPHIPELESWSSWVYDLYRLGQAPVSPAQADQVYDHILRHLVSGFNGDTGSLALMDEAGGHLGIVAGINLPDGVVGSRVSLQEGILGMVAVEGKPLLIHGDLSQDERFRNRLRHGHRTSYGPAMCWPLKIESRLIGVLAINRHSGKQPFSQDDLMLGDLLLRLAGLVLQNVRLRLEQTRSLEELQAAYRRLEEAQAQLLQSEKLASIGQLAAGVAHEINNPVGYVWSNLGTLERYVADLFALLQAYEQMEGGKGRTEELEALKAELDLEYLREDVPALLTESKEGLARVKKIVQDLKDFSHADASDEWQWVDLHRGLESTLNIVWNELKYRAEVKKEYGDLPEVECQPSRLNQVFMNLLVNAAQAIEGQGEIRLRTGVQGQEVWVEVSDTGKGIAPEHLGRVFEPFFTTKPVGKGTGLGLSLSYGIVHKHGGRIELESALGRGTTFRVWLPVRQPERVEADPHD